MTMTERIADRLRDRPFADARPKPDGMGGRGKRIMDFNPAASGEWAGWEIEETRE